MNLLARESYSYAILLVILLAIASLAVYHTLQYLTELIPADTTGTVTMLIVTLTLGFMLIVGAFGIWTIHASGAAESRRRIAQLVTTMDYIRDGVLAVDRRGRIRGANPAARRLVGQMSHGAEVTDVLPCLSREDTELLLRSEEPVEVERSLAVRDTLHEIRLRAQPYGAVTLIFLSDISAINAERVRRRRIGQLQLIGHFARGLGNDFNSMLCTISANVALLRRLPSLSQQVQEALDAIDRDAKRAATLIARLMEIARPAFPKRNTIQTATSLHYAVAALRDNLPLTWEVKEEIAELPPVGLTEEEIEQFVIHLGLLAADSASGSDGTVWVRTEQTSPSLPSQLQRQFAGAVLIQTAPKNETADKPESLAASSREAGAVESFLSAILEEFGGQLDRLMSPTGQVAFRIWLPRFQDPVPPQALPRVPSELLAYVANWRVFIPRQGRDPIPATLSWMPQLGLRAEPYDDLASLLVRLQDGPQADALIWDAQVSGKDTPLLLDAVRKIKPTIGILVIDAEQPSATSSATNGIVSLPAHCDPVRIVTGLIEARLQALRRVKTSAACTDTDSAQPLINLP
ncbi:MAG: hypothetical protein ACUVWX_14080 [Kiritimatiellia bacterium]